MLFTAESAYVPTFHTDCTPAVVRAGSSTITSDTSAGDTAGRSRYVRAHNSDVFTSAITVPTGIPRGKVPPSPELTISVPGLRLLRMVTPRISSR